MYLGVPCLILLRKLFILFLFLGMQDYFPDDLLYITFSSTLVKSYERIFFPGLVTIGLIISQGLCSSILSGLVSINLSKYFVKNQPSWSFELMRYGGVGG